MTEPTPEEIILALIERERGSEERLPVSEAASSMMSEALSRSNPEAFTAWLISKGEEFIRTTIVKFDRSDRSRAARQRPREEFAEAMKQAEKGDTTALRAWANRPPRYKPGVEKAMAEAMERASAKLARKAQAKGNP